MLYHGTSFLSSRTVFCGIAIEKLYLDAGAAEGLYTNLMISGKRSSALISDERIKGVSLTGSEAAGANVAEACVIFKEGTVLQNKYYCLLF